MAEIDLISLGPGSGPVWTSGAVVVADDTALADLGARVADHLRTRRPEAVLFWHQRLGPPPEGLGALLDQPDDLWHAGLALGTGAQPSAIDLVAPTWMLNADPSPSLPATSWRLSLDACLVRREVIDALGFLDPAFASLTGAGLELGHRWITHGALCRYEPALVAHLDHLPPVAPVAAADQIRFVHRRFGIRWALYTTLRNRRRPKGLLQLLAVAREPRPPTPERTRPTPETPTEMPTVSVVIPTVERYPWLRTVLAHLAAQTVPPMEVLVVDQTAERDREKIAEDAPPGLPLRVLVSEVAGQCSARNRALREATGEWVLFVDDDDELPPDLIERHLARLAQTGADANCGTALEPGGETEDPAFRRLRVSDVFPTNNTALRRTALARSGLFDLAFDRGERADHDLGMRLYLAGCRMVLDPAVEVVHHHAPRGGLRTHQARVATYRASRTSLTSRHALAPTELYLWRRYYRPDQVREAVRLRLLGTFSRRGALALRLLRPVMQLALLPSTRRQLADAAGAADRLEQENPRIPTYRP